MGLIFNEFLQNNYHDSFDNLLAYNGFIKVIKELIDEEKVKYFYPKNALNSDEFKQLFFFLDNKIVTAVFSDGTFSFESITSKLETVRLVTPRYSQNETTLELKFSNGIDLWFNSLQDSNSAWNQEYTKYLKEIYKLLLNN